LKTCATINLLAQARCLTLRQQPDMGYGRSGDRANGDPESPMQKSPRALGARQR
jgi:hypothetical protein